jgi:putative peptidoglycan lipid II flippase
MDHAPSTPPFRPAGGEPVSSPGLPQPAWRRAVALLRPSHRHSVFSATVILMVSTLVSRVIGLVRVKYIAYLFGAGPQTDAYMTAFTLPDMIAYFLVGGTASIVFVTILSRYRETGREEEGEHALSVILTAMTCVLGAAIVLGSIFAPLFIHLVVPKFSAQEAALTVHLTRIMLPQPLFIFAGGVFGSVLLVRKQFAYQAVSPLIYNAAIILGGVFLAREMGVSSLAIGVVAGAALGPFALNAWGAHKAGMHFRPSFDWSHPGMREWIKLSLPLMLGVTVVTADNWICNYFASAMQGQISRLNYAKTLFQAPMAILGQAAGAASLPFFASLFNQKRLREFAAAVNSSVSRILAFSFLLSALMIGLAYPAVDLVFRGGSFHHLDASETARYFAIFSVSLFLWAAQAIYARAFYAAGNTFAPMAAGVVVTLVSLPVYWSLFHAAGAVGLSMASDLAILLQTVVLAIMLHRRGMVDLSGLEGAELSRTLLAAVVSLGAVYGLRQVLPAAGRFRSDLLLLAVGTLIWMVAAGATLKLTGSALPDQLLTRFRRRQA